MDTVYIAKNSDAYKAVSEALDGLHFKVKNRRVLVKPNLTVYWNQSGSINTSTEIVRAVLERLQNCEIAIADGGLNTKKAFEAGNWQGLAREFNAELVDLNADAVVWKKIPQPVYSGKMPFAKSVFECDYLVNIAKLKIHSVAGVTLCMKNLFGCVPGRQHKLVYHPHIRWAMLDINQAIKSDFCIIDGVLGNECDEAQAHPVRSDIVIAGTNVLAVDTVGALCMNINPEQIDTFKIAEKLFGKPSIEVKGARVEEVRKNYKTAYGASTKMRIGIEKVLSKICRTLQRQ